MKSRLRGSLGLGTALLAAVALLVLPDSSKPARPAPAAMQLAWPQAKHAALAATLDDGTPYQPGLFLTADTSIGSAPTKDRKNVRLLERLPDGRITVIRSLPQNGYPSFTAITASGDTLVWVERLAKGPATIWTSSLRHPSPRRLVADAGDVTSDQSTDDLVITGGRVYWAAAGRIGVTEIRSAPLAGGAVTVRAEQGDWRLTSWPYLINGVVDTAGTSTIRDLSSGRDQPVHDAGAGIARCSPTWCQVTSMNSRGLSSVALMRPDGSGRSEIGGDDMVAAIAEPVVLDRFEIMAKIDTNTQLTNHVQVIAYELATRRQVVISPDAFGVVYRAGVLWWSAGTDDDFVRHAVDLRTV